MARGEEKTTLRTRDIRVMGIWVLFCDDESGMRMEAEDESGETKSRFFCRGSRFTPFGQANHSSYLVHPTPTTTTNNSRYQLLGYLYTLILVFIHLD